MYKNSHDEDGLPEEDVDKQAHKKKDLILKVAVGVGSIMIFALWATNLKNVWQPLSETADKGAVQEIKNIFEEPVPFPSQSDFMKELEQAVNNSQSNPEASIETEEPVLNEESVSEEEPGVTKESGTSTEVEEPLIEDEIVSQPNNCPPWVNCMPTVGQTPPACTVPSGCEGITQIVY